MSVWHNGKVLALDAQEPRFETRWELCNFQMSSNFMSCNKCNPLKSGITFQKLTGLIVDKTCGEVAPPTLGTSGNIVNTVNRFSIVKLRSQGFTCLCGLTA